MNHAKVVLHTTHSTHSSAHHGHGFERTFSLSLSLSLSFAFFQNRKQIKWSELRRFQVNGWTAAACSSGSVGLKSPKELGIVSEFHLNCSRLLQFHAHKAQRKAKWCEVCLPRRHRRRLLLSSKSLSAHSILCAGLRSMSLEWARKRVHAMFTKKSTKHHDTASSSSVVLVVLLEESERASERTEEKKTENNFQNIHVSH